MYEERIKKVVEGTVRGKYGDQVWHRESKPGLILFHHTGAKGQ